MLLQGVAVRAWVLVVLRGATAPLQALLQCPAVRVLRSLACCRVLLGAAAASLLELRVLVLRDCARFGVRFGALDGQGAGGLCALWSVGPGDQGATGGCSCQSA